MFALLILALLLSWSHSYSVRGSNPRFSVGMMLRSGEIRQVSASESGGALNLLELEVGVQEDPSEYLRMITNHIPKERILRWYISRIDGGKATLEVVVSR